MHCMINVFLDVIDMKVKGEGQEGMVFSKFNGVLGLTLEVA